MNEHLTLYKIGDVTESLSLTPRTIRYYDQLGLLPNSKRSDGFTRLFDKDDFNIIKSIRSIQKKDHLPLEAIKDKLFPSNLTSNDSCFITDSISKEYLGLHNSVTCVPLASDTSPEDISQFIDTIHSQTSASKLFCFYHSSLESFYQKLKTSLTNHTLYFYPLTHFGTSNSMITEFITSNSMQWTNQQELDLIIKRMIRLSFDICLMDSIDTYYPKQSETFPHNLSGLLSTFKPVIISTQYNQSVIGFKQSFETEVEFIVAAFIDALMQRKRYVEKAAIYYLESPKLATMLKEALLVECPNLTLSIKKMQALPIVGSQTTIISII